jgi:geranylgeranyl pyrophosphate synthase
MAYALRAPGKRLRPALTLATYRELGGAGDAVEFASAVEVVHTYSLVHDDLPCMDDDDLRRGRPTVHRQFDVATATEAGFRMVPLAARVLAAGARGLGLADAVVRAAGRELFVAAGATGMIGGQLMDLDAEGRDVTPDELYAIHGAKTGAIIAASAVIGALAAGSTPARVDAAREYGKAIGLAFQIIDDVLDATGTSHQLGKTAGKDARQGKASFAALLGTEAALARAHEHADRAICLLQEASVDSPLLTDLARFVVNRRF